MDVVSMCYCIKHLSEKLDLNLKTTIMRNKKQLLIGLLALCYSSYGFAQEEEWKPTVHYTGYVTTMAEYSTHQDTSATGAVFDKHTGIGLSDAGFLVTYKPKEKIEFKTTLVYTPWVNSFQEYFVETYAAYKYSNKLQIGLGKFLTPLSPGNLYFYSPLNPSNSLPMTISHHFLFPQNVNGIQFRGVFGESTKLGYNLTYGSYQALGHSQGGILGIMGQEDLTAYLGATQFSTEDAAQVPKTYLGGTGRIFADYKGIIAVGANIFEGTKARMPILGLNGDVAYFSPGSRRSYGADVHVKAAGVEINAEYWEGGQYPDDNELTDLEYKGYYGEIIYNIEKFNLKPWVRYEYLEDAKGEFGTAHPLGAFDKGQQVQAGMSSYSFGVAYRPIYEVLVKAEYKHIMVEDHVDESSPFVWILSKMRDYDHYQLAVVFSF